MRYNPYDLVEKRTLHIHEKAVVKEPAKPVVEMMGFKKK